MFRRMWIAGGAEQDFKRRLREYTDFQGDYKIINACTAGQLSSTLRSKVEAAVIDVVKRPSDLKCHHPAVSRPGDIGSWNN